MCRTVKNKFNVENLNYSAEHLNFIGQVDPYVNKLMKFFDEKGVNLNDCNKRYGHSLKNVTLPILKSTNVTLNPLGGLEGVMYANTIIGT